MKSKIVFALIALTLFSAFLTTNTVLAECGGGCTAYPYINGCIVPCVVDGQNAYQFYITNTGSARTYEVFLSCHYDGDVTKWLSSEYGLGSTVAPLFAGLVPSGTHLVATLKFANFLYLGFSQHFRFDRTVDGVCGNVCDSGLSL